jgi:hypothetical protein
MFVDELIRGGVCEDLEEALSMFPIETIDDFRPARRTGGPGEPTPEKRPRTASVPGTARTGKGQGSSRISRP